MNRNPDYPNYSEPDEVVMDILMAQMRGLIDEARRHGIVLHTERRTVGPYLQMGGYRDVVCADPMRVGFPKGPKS